MTDLQDLRGRALLIAKPANMNVNLTEEEKSSKIMNEFVSQVDTAQEILNAGSKLIQMGHFDYRRFKKEIVGTEKRFGIIEMRNLLAKFKEDLQLCKAELPSRKDRSGISRKNTDYSRALKEIGEKLNTIFGKLLKTTRELKVRGERIISDVVDRELLEFELQYGLVESIRSMRERHNDYFLALVCCREGSFHHHILDQFSQDVHSTNGLNAETMKTIYRDLCSNVVCVSSDLSGQGKTEWIKQASFEKKKLLRSFLISDGADFGSLLLTLGFVSSNVDIASFPQASAFIEVASTIQQKLLNSLPITDAYDRKGLNVNDIALYGQNCIKKPLPNQWCQDLIAKYFFEGNADGVSSFRFVEIFVNVLADQLTRLSSSAYFTVENLKQMIKNETTLRTTLVNTFIDVSKDFATRSVKAKAAQLESTSDDYDAKFEIVQSQYVAGPSKWELEDYNRMASNLLLERLECLARRTMYHLDLPLYALSADNIIKMALILLRALANVPVVVMGEAGCGKSSLIGFLSKACNPYRKRVKAQSQAGIKTRVRRYEEQSNLVYQVKPLPDQILDYVWDYGVLIPNDEKKYITYK
ncbi:e3 ubiquitin-protein ligase [Gigaspora margarita]|uniref:E3 ubiquitin-protein ligase n=1 Tax=Gigaspora margarita TaxID=4874 RepID=A0A8H4EJL8_GIGMA|nr:e3 ubiquitin-protein ligase [Gigaspora margarita]